MKKKMPRWIPLLLVTAILILPLAACGGAKSAAPNKQDSFAVTGGFDSGTQKDFDVSGETMAPQERDPEILDDKRKLIRTSSLTVETYSFNELEKKIYQEVSSLNAYIESSSVNGRADERDRRGSYVIRVPDDKLEEFLEMMAGESNITSQSLEVEDITLQYADVEARIKSLRVEQETLLGLLEKAESIEDIISIQDRLSDVRYELESYESQKLLMDNRVDYAVVHLDVHEVQQFTTSPEYSYFDEVKRQFNEGLNAFASFFRNLSLFIVRNVFFVLLLILVIIIIVVLVKASNKRSAKRRAERLKNNPPPFYAPPAAAGVRAVRPPEAPLPPQPAGRKDAAPSPDRGRKNQERKQEPVSRERDKEERGASEKK